MGAAYLLPSRLGNRCLCRLAQPSARCAAGLTRHCPAGACLPAPITAHFLRAARGCGSIDRVNTAQVEALRAVLAPSGWLERTRYFARALRGRARTPHGLLIVGTPTDEPWHMTAHLADESRLAGLPELEPTLVRWAPPSQAPPHLSIGMDRLRHAGPSQTLLVVGSDSVPASLLERVADARKAGASIFALDQGDPDLDQLAHEALAVRPSVDPVSFDGAQHLVSLAVGEMAAGRRAARGRLARVLDVISGPQRV